MPGALVHADVRNSIVVRQIDIDDFAVKTFTWFKRLPQPGPW